MDFRLLVVACYCIGSFPSGNSGRVSHALGLRGPCFTIDTACSATLVALDSAAQAKRLGKCDRSVVAGSNLQLRSMGHIMTITFPFTFSFTFTCYYCFLLLLFTLSVNVRYIQCYFYMFVYCLCLLFYVSLFTFTFTRSYVLLGFCYVLRLLFTCWV